MPEHNEPEMAQGGRIQAEEKHEKTVRSHEPALAKVLDGAWAEDDHAVLSDALPKNDAGVRPPGPLFPWMPAIPFFFLGLGLYRAWIEIAFVTPIFSFPAAQVATHDAYDIVMSVTLLLCAVFSRRLGPLFGKKWFYAVTVALMLLATVLLPISAFFHGLVVPLGWVAVLAGGVGTAFVILLWSELYGCLNPFRVALYYSGSLVIAAAVILLCRGMEFASFFAVSVALPLFSLGMVAAGFRSLPSERLPRAEAKPFAIPWRVILIMGVYAFAYGLKEADLYQSRSGRIRRSASCSLRRSSFCSWSCADGFSSSASSSVWRCRWQWARSLSCRASETGVRSSQISASVRPTRRSLSSPWWSWRTSAIATARARCFCSASSAACARCSRWLAATPTDSCTKALTWRQAMWC